jgi:transcriptional regulator with XRE-family HTH domain
MPETTMPDTPTPTLARNLRAARHAAGLTVEDVAHELGCTASTIYRWEESRHEPPMTTLRRLAELYGVTLAELVGD